jgi:hypothetical protein
VATVAGAGGYGRYRIFLPGGHRARDGDVALQTTGVCRPNTRSARAELSAVALVLLFGYAVRRGNLFDCMPVQVPAIWNPGETSGQAARRLTCDFE